MLEMLNVSNFIDNGGYLPGMTAIIDPWYSPTYNVPVSGAILSLGGSFAISSDGRYIVASAAGSNDYKGAFVLIEKVGDTFTQLSRYQDPIWTGGIVDVNRSYGGYSISGSSNLDTVLMSAPYQGSGNSGEAYIVTRSDNLYTKTATLQPTVNWSNGFFGAISIMDKSATIAAINQVEGSAGSVSIFQKDSEGTWSKTQHLAQPAGSSGTFGSSVSMSDDGVYLSIKSSTRFYMYKLVDGQYAQIQIITVEPTFNVSNKCILSNQGTYLYIPALGQSPNGSVGIYKLNTQTEQWEYNQLLTYPGGVSSGSRFGQSLTSARNGEVVLISTYVGENRVYEYELDSNGVYQYKTSTAASTGGSLGISNEGQYWITANPLAANGGAMGFYR